MSLKWMAVVVLLVSLQGCCTVGKGVSQGVTEGASGAAAGAKEGWHDDMNALNRMDAWIHEHMW